MEMRPSENGPCSFFFPVLADNLFQQIDVNAERTPPCRSEGAGGERTFLQIRLGDGHVTRLVQGAYMRSHISICHAKGIPEFGVRNLGIGRQYGHDGQAALLMNHTVEI